MSDSADKDIERLVEKQARGESAGLPIEAIGTGAAELDTRRSKSGLGSSVFGQGVHVDIPAAEVDTGSFIANQTGIDRLVPTHALTSDPPSAFGGGGVLDVNQYPDLVDQPGYIEAHMQPGIAADAAAVASVDAATTVAQVGDVAPSEVALTANLYPDAVDQPAFIAQQAGDALLREDATLQAQAPAAFEPERMLGEEVTLETQVQIDQSRPA